MIHSREFLHNALAHNRFVHNGSQSVLHDPSVVHGPQQPLVDFIIYARGLYGETLVNMCDSFIHFTRPLHFVA